MNLLSIYIYLHAFLWTATLFGSLILGGKSAHSPRAKLFIFIMTFFTWIVVIKL